MQEPGRLHQLDQLHRLGHLEQEVKLEVGPQWSMPDLNGVIAGARAAALPALALETIYYDTADLRLDRQHLTLRYRREAEGAPMGGRRGATPAPVTYVWTVKLPSATDDDAVLARTELNWVTDAPRRDGAGPPPVHAETAQFLSGVTMGRPLQPVARLRTTRRRTELRTSDGRLLAEVDHDTVEGTNLIKTAGPIKAAGPIKTAPTAPARPGPASVVFTEVEVELAEGSALEVLEAVAARLVQAGARSSSRQSKLATVLHSQAPARARGPGPARRAKARPGATMGDIVRQQARGCLEVLLEHDPPIRLGDPEPEHIHRSRVATRRFRSLLRAVASQVLGEERYFEGDRDDEVWKWFAWLREELRWLGQSLGQARDADVRREWIETQCDRLGTLDPAGAATVLEAAREHQRSSHEQLLDDMRAPRYIHLLRTLETMCRPRGSHGPALAGTVAGPGTGTLPGPGAGSVPGPGTGIADVPPELWLRLGRQANVVLPSLGRRHWRSLRKSVERLGDEPTGEMLHRVRIKAKRFRYVSEFALQVVRPARSRHAAERTIALTTELQDTLGQLHDATVNQQWLRELVLSPPGPATRARKMAAMPTAMAAGQLLALARETELANREAWRAKWGRLEHGRRQWWSR